MSVSKTDLQFYYTSLEPFVVQSNYSQSIGGYPSDSVYSLSSPLVSTISEESASLSTSSALLGSNILIDDEILQIQGDGTSYNVLGRGALSTTARPHAAGQSVYAIPSQSLFNNALSNTLTQYRCLAVRNTNQTDAFYGLTFYFRNTSVTQNTLVQMAIEIPTTEYYSGTAISGSIISIVDHNLGMFSDNLFNGCVVKILSGLNATSRRLVISFDNSTNTLVLDSALPFATQPGDTYEIQNAPAQIVSSGTSTPANGTSNVSSFNSPLDIPSSMGIDIGSRANGPDLMPNETVYLWLSKNRNLNASKQLNNRTVFTAHYRTA